MFLLLDLFLLPLLFPYFAGLLDSQPADVDVVFAKGAVAGQHQVPRGHFMQKKTYVHVMCFILLFTLSLYDSVGYPRQLIS